MSPRASSKTGQIAHVEARQTKNSGAVDKELVAVVKRLRGLLADSDEEVYSKTLLIVSCELKMFSTDGQIGLSPLPKQTTEQHNSWS
jgi:hypothetical protein